MESVETVDELIEKLEELRDEAGENVEVRTADGHPVMPHLTYNPGGTKRVEL